MKKSFITEMPDKSGAFLKAGKIIAHYGGNIVRVSYNKSLDVHTLFLDVSAEETQLAKIEDELKAVGYVTQNRGEKHVLLIALKLADVSGAVIGVLEVINKYDVNISYMNSQENGSGYQHFKMGLYLEKPDQVKALLDEIASISEVSILEYNATEKILDNTVFYIDFINKIENLLHLTSEQSQLFLVESNRLMQLLDERNELPYKTFDYIYRFAEFVTRHKGESFRPLVHEKSLTHGLRLLCVQPPCGSNSFIFENENELLFIDCGFACYRNEMLKLFRTLIPSFDNKKKTLLLTHSDIDHCGIASLFDTVYVSENCYQNFVRESSGKSNYREQNELNRPYYKLSRIISDYQTAELSKMKVLGKKNDDAILSNIATFSWGDLVFDVLEGSGGHVKGETVFVCEKHKLVFTGDIFVNLKGLTKEQKQFNEIAPYLMSGVDISPALAKEIRNALLERYRTYLFCPGHGEWLYPKL